MGIRLISGLIIIPRIILPAFLALMVGCTQPDGPVGSVVGASPNGTSAGGAFSAIKDTSFAKQVTLTGGSPYVYVGAAEGITSRGLFRYYRPQVPSGWSYDSTRTPRIIFYYRGGIGTGPRPEVVAQRFILEWGESSPPHADSLISGATLPVIFNEAAADSGNLTVFIAPDWVADWLTWVDSSAIDSGWTDPRRPDSALTVELKAPAAVSRLLRFFSRNAVTDSLKPRLIIFFHRSDTTGGTADDSLAALPAADLFLLTNDSLITGDRLVVGSGAVYQTNLLFNLDSLHNLTADAHIVVNRAVLTLTRDRNQFATFPMTGSLWPFLLSDSLGFSRPDSAAESGLTVVPAAIDTSLDVIDIVVTEAAARWVAYPTTNFGLAIHSGGEGLDINRIAFHTPRASDPALRPSLKVYWTMLPK